jgi:hypothetical protein
VLRYVRHHKDLTPELQKRIFALASQFGAIESRSDTRVAARPGRTGANGRPALGKIWESAKSFNRRLLSRSRTTHLPHA